MFSEFLEQNRLANTTEVFVSEANYKRNAEARRSLTDNLAPTHGQLLVQQLIERAKVMKPNSVSQVKEAVVKEVQTKEDGSSFKKQMDDLQAKSAKLDQMMEKRKQIEEKKQLESQKAVVAPVLPVAPVPVTKSKAEVLTPTPLLSGPSAQPKQSEIAKFTNILEDRERVEVKKLRLDDSPKGGKNEKLTSKMPPHKRHLEDSESEVSAVSNRQPKAPLSTIQPPKPNPPKDTLNTISNSESNDFGFSNAKDPQNSKKQLRDSSHLNTDNDDIVIQSQGMDHSVDSDVLNEFDYHESIEKI